MNFNFDRSNSSLFYFIFLEYETCSFVLLSVHPVGRYQSFSFNKIPNQCGFDGSISWPRIIFQFNLVNFTIRFQDSHCLLRAKRQLLTKLYQFLCGTSRIDRRSHFRWQWVVEWPQTIFLLINCECKFMRAISFLLRDSESRHFSKRWPRTVIASSNVNQIISCTVNHV